MKYLFLRAPLVALLLAAAPVAFAQTPGVGIGTTTPHSSSALDVSSTSKGLLPPRLTTAQRDAIASPAAGLTLYNTDTNALNTWDGTRWVTALTYVPNDTPNTATFGYTGGAQTYTVPAGVTQLRVDARGAQGGQAIPGAASGGLGARVQATLVVVPGQVLTVYVGGAGSTANSPSSGGGYNGGGNGTYFASFNVGGGGGGGASDVRTSASGAAYTTRLLTAAGGGGGGGAGIGGGGGAPDGAAGSGGNSGAGATQTGGYALGQGGTGNSADYSAGGGGGYYGGYNSATNGGGGGGGSSWVRPGSGSVTLTAGVQTSNGSVTITWTYAAPVLDGSNFVNLPVQPGDHLGNHTATQNLNMGTNLLVGNGGSTGLGISSGGNVGIGTSTPSALLDVNGSTRLRGLAGTGSRMVTADLNGNLVSTALPADAQALSISGSTLSLTNGGSVALPGDHLGNHTATQNLNLGTNKLVGNGGSTGLAINSAGRLGIGTTAPLSDLSISRVTSQTNTPNQTIGELSFVGFNRLSPSASILVQSPAFDDAGHLIFKTSAGGTGALERMRITSDGIVNLTGLAGTGTRTVTVDASGNLTTSALLTDAQQLGLSGSTLSLTNGGSVTLPGDHLGNHTATQNLNLGTSKLVGNGGSTGLAISNAGNASFAGNAAVAGSVGVGIATPAASALLDVSSSTKGFLPPRMSATERDAIASPATGLVVFNTTATKLNVWNGTSWTDAYTSQELAPPAGTVFNYTGAVQTYTVPAGMTQLQVTAAGAQGGYNPGSGNGGSGATVQTTLAVTPGEVLSLYVGGGGQLIRATTPLQGGGWNGGGNARNYNGTGGGASDIRRGGTALTNRIVVAGGGGGCFYFSSAQGGSGGGPIGGDGTSSLQSGATQTAGGQGGTLGQGVDGGDSWAAGGGGYYGGGVYASNGSSGGGGSSWANQSTTTYTTYTAGNRNGNGYIALLPSATSTTAAISGANLQLLQLSQTQRDALASPTAGLLVYNLTTGRLNFYTGTAWVEFFAAAETGTLVGAGQTYYPTGALQTYTVPAGVTALSVDAKGASGGSYRYMGYAASEGRGARVQATLAVTPGQVLNLYVGGAGQSFDVSSVYVVMQGGYNGGGNSGTYGGRGGGGGGGATDIRTGGTAASNRVLVAAGGGGAAPDDGANNGGAGGTPTGGNGGGGFGYYGGAGGTQTTGGAAGQGGSPIGSGSASSYTGGGGGGGYFGGGADNGGGGGGSSYVATTGFSNVQYSGLPTSGGGSLTLTPVGSPPAPTLDGSNISGTWTASGADVYRATGNVGIGTSTPAQKLDVAGNANVTGTTAIGGTATVGGNVGIGTTAPTQKLDVRGNATVTGNSYVSGNVGIGNAAPTQKLDVTGNANVTGNSTVGGNSTIIGNTTIGGTATVSGNVGIGNAAPTQKLDVTGNANVTGNATIGGNETVAGNVGIGTAAPAQKLDVAGNTNVSGNSYVSGNVGIGTTTPVQKLEVVGAAAPTTITTAPLLRLSRPTTSGVKWPNTFDIALGSYATGANSQTRLDFNLGYGATGNADVTVMTLNGNGNVGIGTPNPLTTLSLSDVTSQSNTPGQVVGELSFVGFNRTVASATIRAESPGFDDASHLIFKTSAGGAGAFERMRISSDGLVGIGTATPGVPLDVQSGVNTTLSSYGYLSSAGGASFYGGAPVSAPVSIRASGRIVASEFNAVSDARLKSICGLSDNATDLGLLNRLRITDYTMRDRVQFGDRGYKKVIAQEVEQVLPQAVTRQTGFLPDVYATATAVQAQPGDSLLVLTLPAGLPTGGAVAGQRLKLIGDHSQVLAVVVRPAATGARTLTVRGAAALVKGPVFVYGLEHTDVRAVDYEALSMLNVSATQELARQVEALKARATAAEAHAATAEADHADLQTVKEQLARLLGGTAPTAAQARK